MCQSYKFILELYIREMNVFIKFSLPTRKTNGIYSRHRLFRSQRDSSYKFNANAFLPRGVKYQGRRIRKIYEDCVFCHHEISQLSSRESRKSRKRRVASPALVGTKECCLQPFQPDGKLRAFCDAVFAWLARFAWNKIIEIQSFMREDSDASAQSTYLYDFLPAGRILSDCK